MGEFKEEITGAISVREEQGLRREASSKEGMVWIYTEDWMNG